MKSGAACETTTGARGTVDRWTAADNSRVDVLVTSDPDLLAAISRAELVPVDGIGTLKILDTEDLETTPAASADTPPSELARHKTPAAARS